MGVAGFGAVISAVFETRGGTRCVGRLSYYSLLVVSRLNLREDDRCTLNVVFSVVSRECHSKGPLVAAAGLPLGRVGKRPGVSGEEVCSQVLRRYAPVLISNGGGQRGAIGRGVSCFGGLFNSGRWGRVLIAALLSAREDTMRNVTFPGGFGARKLPIVRELVVNDPLFWRCGARCGPAFLMCFNYRCNCLNVVVYKGPLSVDISSTTRNSDLLFHVSRVRRGPLVFGKFSFLLSRVYPF